MNEEMKQFLVGLERVTEKHPQYKREAYHFVMAALHFTLQKLSKVRHVTGQELCLGIREYALDQFGPLALTVFEHWGVRTTDDFGAIVFNMIEEKLMTKTDEDTIDDFHHVYDFAETFRQPTEFDLP